MSKGRLFLILFLVTFTSCSSLRYAGVDRIARYDIVSPDVPDSLEGYRVCFASDFHLPSRFRQRQLRGTVSALKSLHPDLILLGGDYQEGCEWVEPLFEALGTCNPPDGIHAVLGNNDFERCTDEILLSMDRNHIIVHSYNLAWLSNGLVLCGIPYCSHAPLAEPLKRYLPKDGFVILFTHSPDIVESAGFTYPDVDVALAGHTHGGQITLFGLVAPQTGSRYGKRFLYGMNRTTGGVPIITSRGLGTSRFPMRFCAPTDIILLTLYPGKSKSD